MGDNERLNYDLLPVSAWGAADLSNLVSCCPGVCRAGTLDLHPGAHVSVLQNARALRTLQVYCNLDTQAPGSFQHYAQGLAALTRLRRLELTHAGQPFEFASVLPLTSLTFVDYLVFEYETGGDAPDSNNDAEDRKLYEHIICDKSDVSKTGGWGVLRLTSVASHSGIF